MDMIKIVLSSAVVVAFINLILQNKSNKLNYVTGERAKWRECLKRIAVEIAKADITTIQVPLTELKVNINGYGNYRNNPDVKEKMDVFRDEHIWEIIFRMEEECIKGCNSENFEEYKEKLIDYIGFLLKFEWERSKSEVKSDYCFLLSLALALAGIIGSLISFKFNNSSAKNGNLIHLGLVLLIPCSISWIPALIDKIKLFREKKWFRNLGVVVAWACSMLFFGILALIFYKELGDWILFLIYSFVFSLFSVINGREQHLDYSNKLYNYMKPDWVVIYYRKSSFRLMRAETYLNRIGIEYYKVKISEDADDLHNLAEVKNIGNKKVRRLVDGLRENEGSAYHYICQNTRPRTYIIRYKDGEDIYITIGRDKKTWKKWFKI